MNIAKTFGSLVNFVTGQAFNKSIVDAIAGSLASAVIGNALGGDSSDGDVTTQTQQTWANPFQAGGGLFTTNWGPGVVPGSAQAMINRQLGLQAPNQMLNFDASGVMGSSIPAGTPTTPTGGVAQPQLDAATMRQLMELANQQVGTGNWHEELVEKGTIGKGGTQLFETRRWEDQVRRGLQEQDLLDLGITDPALIQQTLTQFGGRGETGLPGFDPDGWAGQMAGMVGGVAGAGGAGQNFDMAMNDPNMILANQLGLFGANQALQASLNSETAARAGELGLDFMNQLSASSPMDVAQQQFDLLNPILQDQQQQDQLALENRLRAQGRLGSSGSLSGQADLNAMFDSQSDAERKLLFDSLGMGLGVQAQNAALAGQFSQLDPTLRGAFQNLGTNFLNIPLTLQNAMLNQGQVVGGLAGATNTGQLTQPGFNAQEAIGAGLLNSGIAGLANSIPGLFNQGATSGTYTAGDPRPSYTASPHIGDSGYISTVGR